MLDVNCTNAQIQSDMRDAGDGTARWMVRSDLHVVTWEDVHSVLFSFGIRAVCESRVCQSRWFLRWPRLNEALSLPTYKVSWLQSTTSWSMLYLFVARERERDRCLKPFD